MTMPKEHFDICIIGAGPGGYVCAIRAAQLGLRTCIVEKDQYLGGTCLNVGCIPSKALLHSTEMYHFTVHQSRAHGIETGDIRLNLHSLMKRKEAIVNSLRRGVETLVRNRRITIYRGLGTIPEAGRVNVSQGDAIDSIPCDNIVIATGSKVAELPFMPFDGHTVVSSDDAIAFESVPRRLLVVGGGAIGLELGSVWARLGSEITVVEALPNIAPTFDESISRAAARVFKKQGLRIETSAQVTGLHREQSHVVVSVQSGHQTLEFEVEKVLVAVGRVPNTANLGLRESGVGLDARGFVLTDENLQTDLPGIYAIGDTVEGPMLAHRAEEEGIAVAETIAGRDGEVNYEVIPNVIYTNPEIASVGISETEARERGFEVRIGQFPMAANGRAVTSDATEGVVKIIAHSDSDQLLGVQVFARNASEIIASAVAHMEYGGSAEDLARTIHAHPTLSEALKEAALAVDGLSIHSL